MERSALISEIMTRIGSIKRLMHAQRYQNDDSETITGPQVAILFTMKRHGGISQHELAKQLFMTAGGVSQLVDQLIAIGFVVRTQVAHDRRSYTLQLSDTGIAFTDKIARQHLAMIEATTADIADDELAGFVGMLDKIATALKNNHEIEKD